MKIYFEKFGEDCAVSYLTPWKLYEVVELAGNGSVRAKIKDDVGDEIIVEFNDDYYTGSSWKVLPEETKALSAVDIITSPESERNDLANTIDSVNELLDSMAVPKAETLAERVYAAISKAERENSAGIAVRTR